MYIKWPTNGLNTVKEFNKLRGKNSFPDVFGCVDSTHIPIPTQLSDDLYRNKKGFHSVILQCICNAKMEFIDIYCGWPGSINDARVWENSPIYEKLRDFAYPLQKFIMVPFKENEHLSTKQRQFNAILSNTAALIEQSFGILKGIFRRLKYIYVTKLTNIKYIIISCCILHNIGLRNNDVEDFVIQDDDNDDLDESENVPTSDCEEAVELRNCIMNKIFYITSKLTRFSSRCIFKFAKH
ncbi:hypothetical protein NQ314_006098 [Rhamnusium bicolor]|uniref:DDE Tnp4 domain-containing protein n=1 Tax=Rhamnusium bicolor TaxID=1586634 RepID=A0AAV8Z972_9CUCU|nr:hypothetical protein NQ314_006098 [Rhamnusium bicolor]